MPKANGLDVLLASKDLEPDRPVVIVTGYPSVASAVKLASLGATDYVTKPFDVELIRITIAKVLAQRDFARKRDQAAQRPPPARTDGPPGPYDSTVFVQLLEKEIARSRFRGHRFSLMVVKVDEIVEEIIGTSKDVEGGQIGLLFEAVRSHLRPGDYVGQTDSDQLSVILPETGQAEAARICDRISTARLPGLDIVATAVGFPEDARDLETLVSRAEKAIRTVRTGTI